ncbi:hypothetical protein JYU19_00170 [bacterium AH-315-J21]|nr:hypothetical protein [bacterium AH-315-J21]
MKHYFINQNSLNARKVNSAEKLGLKGYYTLSVFIGALLLLSVGCSQTPIEAENTDTINTSAEFGGFTATDEQPAFGSPEFAAIEIEAAGVEVVDAIAAQPEVVSMESDPEARSFVVRVQWGKLEFDSTIIAVTDWSGSMAINRGAEVVRRKIHFEDGQDELLPRTDRRLIEWVSKTTVHNDGLLVEIFNPRRPDSVQFDTTVIVVTDTSVVNGDTVLSDRKEVTVDTTVFDSPLTMTFATGPLTVSFSGSELMTLDTIIYVQDSCAVLIQSTRIDRKVCPKGYLAGKWGVTDDGAQVFRGVWMTKRGTVDGHLKGHWGVNDDGKRMFWGKWISANGRFEGFLRGGWAPHPDEHASDTGRRHSGGAFKGQIFNSERAPIGFLRGRYKSSDNPNANVHGRFAGKWKLRCGDRMIDDDGGHAGRTLGDDEF